MSQPILTQERLRSLFDYDPQTGVLTRKSEPSSRSPIGAPIGGNDGAGYLQTIVDGRRYRLHRLIYLYMLGTLPEHYVDHLNRNRSDNRWQNIRHATRTENAHNIGISGHNTSGFTGVSWAANCCKWEARITLANKGKVLGYFDTREAASEAYKAAKLIYHPTAPVAQQGA